MVFEPSYQEPACWRFGALLALGAGEKIRIFKVNIPIDPTARRPCRYSQVAIKNYLQ
jgi:hypothetical protein